MNNNISFFLKIAFIFAILNQLNSFVISKQKKIEYSQQLFPLENSAYSIGQVGGVATNEDGNLIIFHRAGRVWDRFSFLWGNNFNTELGPIEKDILYLVDQNNLKKIDSWGSGLFYMPHGLTVDFEGNIWLTDVGSHQVLKYNLNDNPSEPLLTLGEKFKPGNDENHFCKPTTVAVRKSNSDIFVADGYCNQRIVRFDKNGKFIRQYQDESKPIRIAHSIALIESLNLICTVSREEGRIICFDVDSGEKVHELTDSKMRTVYAIKYDPTNEVIHAATGENHGLDAIGLTFDANKKNFGKLLQRWNGEIKDLADAHDLAISPDGSKVYLGQLNSEIDEFNFS